MTLADLFIVSGLLVCFIVLGFVRSTAGRAPQPRAQPRPGAVTSAHRPMVPPSDSGERLTALELAELARLGEVRREAEARLRKVGR